MNMLNSTGSAQTSAEFYLQLHSIIRKKHSCLTSNRLIKWSLLEEFVITSFTVLTALYHLDHLYPTFTDTFKELQIFGTYCMYLSMCPRILLFTIMPVKLLNANVRVLEMQFTGSS